MVDVLMPVYNHEKYLNQAIESVVTQITDFKFRLLIGEDCSKDSSREIVKQYASLYPEIIVTFLHEKNLGSTANSSFLLNSINSKYFAMCEGDDYWIDDRKLQKQIDFLEKNPDYTLCFTDIDVVNEMNVSMPHPYKKPENSTISIQDIILIRSSIVPTASVVYRNILSFPLPKFYTEAIYGDLVFQLLMTDKGKGKYINEKTAVYRQHSAGISQINTTEFGSRESELVYDVFHNANEYFDFKYDKLFKKSMLELAKTILIYGSRNLKGYKKIKYILLHKKKYFKNMEKIYFKEIIYYSLLLFFPTILKSVTSKKSTI